MSLVKQPRVLPGRPDGGAWTDRERNDAVLPPLATETVTAAPGLIELTPATRAVIDAVTAAGGRPLIVGGSVRDALLARKTGVPVSSKDVDIEVHGLENHQQLIDALTPLGHVDERGVSFGVVTALVDGEDFDLSLPRRDSKTGEGHTGFTVEVDPTLNLRDAAARRDLTLNSLYWDPASEELIDCFGGAADLDAGILRHTSDAFAEDPLRVLRSAQFAARFSFDLAPETADLARTMVDRFSELSTERVWGEWRKMARRGAQPSKFLTVLVDTGWIENFPELRDTIGIEQDPAWHPEGDVFTHLGLAGDAAAEAAERAGLSGEDREVVVLGALVHDFGKVTHTQTEDDGRITSAGHAESGVAPVTAFLDQIGAPKAVTGKVAVIVSEHMCTSSHAGERPSKHAMRRFLRRLDTANGGPTVEQWAAVVAADQWGRGSGAKVSPVAEWLEVAAAVGPPIKPLLLGSHLARAGYAPGPGWQMVIAAALIAQDEGAFEDEAGAEAWFATSGLIPIGFPVRPSMKQQHQIEKWRVAQVDLVSH